MKKILGALFVTLILSACIESKIESFTDPDYKEAKFTKIAVDLNSLPPTSRLKAGAVVMQRLKEAGYDAVPLTDILVPTRTYEPEQARELIASSGYQYVLAINVTGDNSNSSLVGFNSYNTSNYNVYGNNVNGQSRTYTTPIIAASGSTALKATIYDIKTGNTAWQASVLTEAGGTAFVGNTQAIAHSVMGSIIDKLKADGHS